MIEVSHLTKQYGNHTAVSDLSFTIEEGHVYGFLGPNGAGKSTTMNIIAGCLSATSGSVKIGGYDVFEEPEKAKQLLGYLPEQPPLYQDMTPREYLTFVAEAKGVARGERAAQVNRVIEQTRIQEYADRLIRHMSKGYRQRVGVAQALLGNPQVIILDEPTVGLDPKQIIEIRDLILELGKAHTVILSSHILSEVSAICDRIIIIAHGRMVANDTMENLEQRMTGTLAYELTVKTSETQARAILSSFPAITGVRCAQGEAPDTIQLSVETDSAEDISENLFFAFAEQRCAVLRQDIRHTNLEAVFLELTGEDTAPAAKWGEEETEV